MCYQIYDILIYLFLPNITIMVFFLNPGTTKKWEQIRQEIRYYCYNQAYYLFLLGDRMYFSQKLSPMFKFAEK